MRTIYLAAPLAALFLLVGCRNSSYSQGDLVADCTVATGINVADAQVSVTNMGSRTVKIGGLHVQGWNNGARVADVDARWNHQHKIRPGHTRKWHFTIDPRSKACTVADLPA